jgi:hypothetical protein
MTAPLTYPRELTPELRQVLGLMIFQTAPVAHMLRDFDGQDIPRRAEDEQAAVLHWLISLALEHGAGWHEKALERLASLRGRAAEQPPESPPAQAAAT